MPGSHEIWRRTQSAVETVVSGDIGLYDPRSETVVLLNQTASDVWRLSDGDLSVGDLAEALASSYQVEVESIREQVSEVIADLASRGLLTRVES